MPRVSEPKAGWDIVRILGLDPAAAGPTGYGIIESDGRKHRLVHYGALKVAPQRQKESQGATLEEIHKLVCGLIRDFAPHVMAVENVFTALNMRTALRLAEVRGVVLLAAEQHGLQVHSYSPREVKASVAGYGQADKRQMQIMVRALLAMTECPEPADAADALAVALCHLQAEERRRRSGAECEKEPVGTRLSVADSANGPPLLARKGATHARGSRISSVRVSPAQ